MPIALTSTMKKIKNKDNFDNKGDDNGNVASIFPVNDDNVNIASLHLVDVGHSDSLNNKDINRSIMEFHYRDRSSRDNVSRTCDDDNNAPLLHLIN